jgi:hypothetical protein
MPKVRVPRKNVTPNEVVTVRAANTFGTARRVADALRRSPEFRSL